jgi:trans-aconitate methyltransferase
VDNWQHIWNRDERLNNIILDCLIRADGFDTSAGSFTVTNWLEYVGELTKKINLNNFDTVFDVGCGSGAFLFPLSMNNHEVGGVDYSKPLIDLASIFFKSDAFIVNEAINIDIKKAFDVVISHSVFHYFKDLEYAREVVISMIQKSKRKVAFLDINDKSKEDKYHQIRMKGMNKEEYKQKYNGLNHMFYHKGWFENIAQEFNLKCEIFDQDFSDYGNSTLRFNVIMTKL